MPIEAEHAVIDRMASLRASGETYRAIAAALNGEGVEAPAGTQWHAPTVRKVLVRDGHAQ